uniref:Putative secreted protein n=1 Tax=Anopheles darlingi TaxID=43151 RepID=A0A2M4DN73_ANODA
MLRMFKSPAKGAKVPPRSGTLVSLLSLALDWPHFLGWYLTGIPERKATGPGFCHFYSLPSWSWRRWSVERWAPRKPPFRKLLHNDFSSSFSRG